MFVGPRLGEKVTFKFVNSSICAPRVVAAMANGKVCWADLDVEEDIRLWFCCLRIFIFEEYSRFECMVRSSMTAKKRTGGVKGW